MTPTDPPTPRRRPRRRVVVLGAVVLVALGAATATAAIATDTLDAGEHWQGLLARVERLVEGPVPDRPAPETVLVTEEPLESGPSEALATPTPVPSPSATPSGPGSPTPTVAPTVVATPTPTPRPIRKAVDIKLSGNPARWFVHQAHKDWCAVAGVQAVLARLGRVNTSDRTQEKIAARINEWDSYKDSHNGDWGPSAMVLALDAYGAPGYEVRAFDSRQAALRNAARAIQKTGAPVLLLAWRGAHTWVMSGFRADADPSVFRDAFIKGAYILDPWYPWVSSIWGPSDPPGTYQDEAEMIRNFLRWKRPEGAYPARDGRFIIVAPTIPVRS